MSDRAALLANVLDDPADDTARLVLADWLEEHGEEPFGRFVRAGVLAAQYHARDQLDEPEYYELLRTIADVTTSGVPARWLSALGLAPQPLTDSDWVWDNTGDRVTVRIGTLAGVFTRGLLSELVLSLAEWYEFAPHALAAWPIARATITDVDGLSFFIAPPAADRLGWQLSAVLVERPRERRSRRRGLLGAILGRPVEPTARALPCWSADRPPFLSRAELVRSAGLASAILFEEIMDAGAANWPAPPGPV